MSLTGNTRTRVTPDHALITPDTFVRAPLPGWFNSTCIVHISPEMGARFKEYTVEMQPGGVGEMKLLGVERVVYVLEGNLSLEAEGKTQTLKTGSYAFLPPDMPHRIFAQTHTRLLVIDKPFQSLIGMDLPELIVGYEPDVKGTPLGGDPHLMVQTLLPDHPRFDMAFNVMNFAIGAHLPFVETHVMEHGLVFIQGGGVYRLADSWYTVQQGDIIWMASYCPQWFGALGQSPSRYLIYKDVNRHSLETLL